MENSLDKIFTYEFIETDDPLADKLSEIIRIRTEQTKVEYAVNRIRNAKLTKLPEMQPFINQAYHFSEKRFGYLEGHRDLRVIYPSSGEFDRFIAYRYNIYDWDKEMFLLDVWMNEVYEMHSCKCWKIVSMFGNLGYENEIYSWKHGGVLGGSQDMINFVTCEGDLVFPVFVYSYEIAFTEGKFFHPDAIIIGIEDPLTANQYFRAYDIRSKKFFPKHWRRTRDGILDMLNQTEVTEYWVL